MTRDDFRQRMDSFKKARESNPQLSYWEWKVNKYVEGTDYVEDTYLPEVVVTPRGNYVNQPFDQDAYNSAMLDVWSKQTKIGPEDIIDYLPIIGDAKGIYDISKDFYDGNTKAGLIGLGLTILPNFLKKPLRYIRNNSRKFLRNMSIINRSRNYKEYDEIQHQLAKEILNQDIQKSYSSIRKQLLRKFSQKYRNLMAASVLKEKPSDIIEYVKLIENRYGKNTKQTREIKKIIQEDPNYLTFLINNKELNPLDQQTVNKFLTKQSTSVRGVSFSPEQSSKDDINQLVEQALTVNSTGHHGGDRLGTGNTGIYTSNSGEIADRFSRPQGNINDVRLSRADVALLRYPYKNDETLSIRDQLSKFRRSIYPFDLLNTNYGYKQLADMGFFAKEGIYTNRIGQKLPGYERAYFAKETDKPILNIIDQNTTYTNVDKKGRWGLDGVESAPELETKLFEGFRPGTNLGDFIRFAKVQVPAEYNPALYDTFYDLDKEIYKKSNAIAHTKDKRIRKALDLQNNVLDNTNGFTEVFIAPLFKNKKYSFGTDQDGIEDARQFVLNWFNSRKQYDNPVVQRQLKEIEQNHSLINRNVKSSDYNLQKYRENQAVNTANVTIQNGVIDNNPNVGGYYHPNYGIVLQQEELNNKNRASAIHEFSHILNTKTKSIKNIINNIQYNQEIFDRGNTMNQYLTNPSEVHSRLMEFRKLNNLNPTKLITMPELQNIKKNGKDAILFDLYKNDNIILDLLNNVASNNQKTKNNIIKAANGTDQDGIQFQANSELTPEQQAALNQRMFQMRRMSGGISPVFDIQTVSDFTPIGNVITAYDIYNSVVKGDYITAGLIGAAALAPKPIVKAAKRIWHKIPKVNPKYFENKLTEFFDIPLLDTTGATLYLTTEQEENKSN